MDRDHSGLCGYNEVVLVGNGPSALDFDAGETIDKFKWVARFNSFKTSGYEKQVGEKSDIWVTCESTNVNNMLPYKRIYFATPEISPTNKECRGFRAINIYRPDHKRLFQIPYWAWWEMRANFFSRKPTIGAVISYYFSHIFSKVYIYGFDFLDPEKHHHYFGKKKGNGTNHHSPEQEANYFRTMIETERLFLLKDAMDIKGSVK